METQLELLNNDERLDQFIREANLPSPPLVAQKLLELSASEDSRLEEFSQAIEKDPALAVKLLKLANSAFYGLRSEVRSLDRAVVVLGIKPVKSLALSFSLVGGLQTLGQGFDHNLYWRRSILAGTAARHLAVEIGAADPEEAFLAGLLQDIGVLVLAEAEPETYGQLFSQANRDHDGLRTLELEKLGIDHTLIGAQFLKEWRLPELFSLSVLGSHDPSKLMHPPEEVVSCVAVSGALADIWLREDMVFACHEATRAARSILELDYDSLEDVLERVAEDAPNVSKLFAIQFPGSGQIQAVLQKAKELSSQLDAMEISFQNQIESAGPSASL